MHQITLPVSSPDLNGNEEAYVVDALRSTWISSAGKYVDRFEAEFAVVAGTRHASSVSNGTTALHLALLALDVGAGDEVIIPAFAYVAVANTVRYVGATPVLVDVQNSTWCLDPAQLEGAITPRTRAIVAVHNYGHPCDMDSINRIADRHGLRVVEDAAEAHFARYKGRAVGSLGNVATFSFYGNKVITCGEGGALSCDSDELHERIRMLRSQGMDRKRRYFHPIVGYNYRLTNVACAILCAQLERRDQILERRRAIYRLYDERLSAIPGVMRQPAADWAEISPWLYCITIDEARFGVSRDALADRLGARGIDTRPFFYPIYRLPPYETAARGAAFPVTERLSREGMNLPTFPEIGDEDVARICSGVEEIGRERR